MLQEFTWKLESITCILFGDGLVRRYMEAVTITHLKTAQRICRYVKSTLDFGLFATTKYTYYNKSYYNKNDYCGNTRTITSIHQISLQELLKNW